eukprot:scaffold16864_cov27-Tisochrysis_lutea.AAC.10
MKANDLARCARHTAYGIILKTRIEAQAQTILARAPRATGMGGPWGVTSHEPDGAFVKPSQPTVPHRCQGQLSHLWASPEMDMAAARPSSRRQAIKQRRPPSPSLQVLLTFNVNMKKNSRECE